MSRSSPAGLRRRSAVIGRPPVWTNLPDLPHLPPSAPPRRRIKARHKLWMALVAGVAIGMPLWFLFRDADVHGVVPRPQTPPEALVDVELPPPAEEPPDEFVSQVPQPLPEPVPTASVPSIPSVGLVSSGPTGGSGSGAPGLDLGLEGGEPGGLVVAAGGGGSGGGVGTGTGSGVGSQRFIYEPGQVDQDARPSGTLAEPAYPRRADEDGIEALVEVRLLIDERGRVEEMEILGAPPGYGFEASLRKASTRWRFEPARLGGVPVPEWVRMPWQFRRPG